MRAEDILPDKTSQVVRNGVIIRKGSVGAFLANARNWEDPQATPGQRSEAERDIISAVPALRALGLFDILAVRSAALQRLIDAN